MEEALKELRSQLPVQSEVFYNGVAQKVSQSIDQPMPSEHATTFTNYPLASKEQVAAAIESALKAKKSWEETPFVDRAAIFMKAAELATGKYRYELIAATMLGQGKNVWQGEIDAAAELADFFRQNCNFAAELMGKQPPRNTNGMWRYVLPGAAERSPWLTPIVAWNTAPSRDSCTRSRPSISLPWVAAWSPLRL